MLTPKELYAAQGFPSTYIIDGYRANARPVQKDQQVAKCGNSVSPEMARAMVQASVPDMCIGSGRVLSLERYKPAAGQMEFSL
jgi:DNA (cytosine-5)-methyltransferase 1